MARAGWTFLQGAAAGAVVAWMAFELTAGRFAALPPDLAHYRSVRDFARDSFVREVTDEELLDHALHGMLSGLDGYSRYYDRDEAALLERETAGRYVGLGVVFRDGIENGLVLFPLAGSPGERAGIRVGDQLLEVDGQPLEELGEALLRARIEGSERDPVALRLRGRDGTVREVRVRAESVVDPTVRHTRILDETRGIGYTAIVSFSHETPGEFDRAFEHLERHGMQAMVLDLRANYGGVLESAVAVARRFIADGVIVTTEGRGTVSVLEAERSEARHVGFPLVVLVDGESASASEVLAGALQDHRAAVITGSPSYGKGMVQTIRHFDDEETRAKVTSSYYYSPTHRNFEKSADEGEAGITPDLVIETDEGERRTVHAFLGRYSPPLGLTAELAAWEEESGLELLERAPEDAQLAAALALLSGERPGPYSISWGER